MAYYRPARVSMSIRPVLHLLHHQLRLVSILKQSLPNVTYPLLQLTLKLLGQSNSYRHNHFYSFTETKSDFSLILDVSLFKELEQYNVNGEIQIAEDIWRPLTVEIGAFGSLTGISKIAANVIGPLADEGVSVFCLSTNQDDYVLVKEKDIYKALCCLSSCFKIVTDSKRDIELVDRIDSLSSNTMKKCDIIPPRAITHPFTCTASKFHVCSILPSTLCVIAQPLLQLMFFNQRSHDLTEDVFFSLSIIKNDISMIVDAREIDRFPEDCVYSSEAYWKVITIGDGPLGFDECGIVAQVAAPLAQAEISTYYICTFNNDHTLVPEDSVMKALKILNKYLITSSSNKMETTPTAAISRTNNLINTELLIV